MINIPKVIAIDGPSAAGKSSVGASIAQALDYPFLDTGSLYRALTWVVLRQGIDLDNEQLLTDAAGSLKIEFYKDNDQDSGLHRIVVDGEDVMPYLRDVSVEAAVSLVSRIPGVRQAQLKIQRELAGTRKIVMAGRDIGTVVVPNADLKIYLDASLTNRTRRRYEELKSIRSNLKENDVYVELQKRDELDYKRSSSPLRPADDAIIISTDNLSLGQVVDHIISLIRLEN